MSLRRRLLRASALLWSALLAGVGVATAAMLHRQALAELDQTLLAVARQEAHPPVTEAWVVEYTAPRVQVQRLQDQDPSVSLADQAEALATEHPLWRSVGEDRMVLLPVEVDSGAADRPERYALVMARAPLPGPAQTVGMFVLVYTAVAAGAGIVGVLGLDRLLRRALLPIEHATDAVARVGGLQSAERLQVEGPEEVRALLGGVNGLLERLQRAAEAQARFTAEAAHELRTPLSGLRGGLEVALRRPRSAEDYREGGEQAHREVLALGELVEALLAFARVDAGQTPDLWERERPSELLRLALRAEQPLLQA
ncbi:MAG TPA: histidine kinase dimerization/phospho-acceptor domain-containing protein, partial [Myxococcota bacterium]|nr:histidine kinase dimerization/phospho-acceptor domain-containing protein [Myxococcota bacterium]